MKEFKTINEQIDLLKNRGLQFNDEVLANKLLLNNNYYNIINGYKEPFITAGTKDNFINQATFEEIFALYDFDKSIKDILLEHILKVENNLRSLIAYYFSKYHGNDNYLKLSNFEDFSSVNVNLETKQNRIKDIQNLISSINKEIANTINSKEYIKHYMIEYGFVPPWVLVNILSFGKLSKFLELMKQNERIEISKNFNITENELVQYTKLLSYFRNLCAHDDRIYNATLPKFLYIPDNQYHIILNIGKTGTMYTHGKNDLFALIIALKIMLSETDFRRLYNKIYGRIKSLEKKLVVIKIDVILSKMNFPKNWRDIKKF
ncbi:MAG: Abi family protein [Bacilli bacterium]|nr:Abi family protein [Bacilli bacterium]